MKDLVIKKAKCGYAVYSHKGKRLSKKCLSKKQAKKRLRQIEYFKHASKRG